MPTTVTRIKPLGQTGTADGLRSSDRRPSYGYHVTLSAADPQGGDIALAEKVVDGGIPQPGDYGTGGLVVTRRSARWASETPLLWRVEIEYGFDETITSSVNVKPWQRKPLVNWDVVEYPFVLINDLATPSKHVTNSAGEPFDPPVMTSKYNRKASVRFAREVSALNIDDVQDLVGTLNASSVTIRSKGYNAKKCLLRSATANETRWTDNTPYYELSYTIEIENEVPLEIIKVQNKGFYYLTTASDKSTQKVRKVKDPTDPNKEYPAMQPLFLNSDGTESSVETDPLEFTIHKSENWGPLKLS